jgi:hypothetical protein
LSDLFDDEDDLTEITFMKAPRVDMVGSAANGFDFLLAKSTGDPSLFTEDEVLALAKSAQEGDMTAKTTASTAPVADEDLTKDALDPETLLDTPDVAAGGDPSDPGSPAWEAVDAARATQAIELTVALKRLVETAVARESQEALIGDDPDDAENVWNLSDVVAGIDCILGVLAPYAVTEQAEADGREADDTLILKSGRVLSGTNEGNIRQAAGLLESVLSSLPAPVEEAIAKSETPEGAAVETEALAKAKGDPQVLVYDANGNVVGSVDPADLTTFANSTTPAAADDSATDTDAATDDATDPTTATPADPAPAAPDGSVPAAAAAADTTSDAEETPADPADGTVIPGTDTVQSPADDGTEDVKKALVAEAQAALTELLEPIAKQLGAIPELAGAFEQLQKRVDDFGKRPDDRNSPTLNGVTTAGVVARGGSEDTLGDLRKAVEEAPDPVARRAAQSQLSFASIKDRFSA